MEENNTQENQANIHDQIEESLEKDNDLLTYNPEEFEKKKRDNIVSTERTEYNNCIFINGADIENFIFNSGRIYGDISQGNIRQEVEADPFRCKSSDGLESLFKEHSETGYRVILITLIALKIVPTAHLFSLAERLNMHISSGVTEQTKVGFQYYANWSIEDVLKILGSEKIIASIKSEAGELPVSCITLKDRSCFAKLATTIWNEYPGFRDGIMKWLLEISEIKELRPLILHQIANAIASFSAADFSYAKTSILPYFTHNKKRDDFYFLRQIFTRCLLNDDCKCNAETLLIHWCRLEQNDFLWKIALAICSTAAECKFYSAVCDRINQIIQRELQQGILVKGTKTIYYFKPETGVPFRILQENANASDAYLTVFASCFAACETYQDYLRFGYYASSLLWIDYMEEGYPNYQSIFISSLNRKEIRTRMIPVMCYIWKKQPLRTQFMEPVFCAYVKELESYQKPWEYMKRFLKTIAFTGNRIDYDNTIRMLERLNKINMQESIPKQMIRYLKNLLCSR